jgi:hypothetical protein
VRYDLNNPRDAEFLARTRDRATGKTLLQLAREAQSVETVVSNAEAAKNSSRVTQSADTEQPKASYNRNRNKKCERHGLKFDSIYEADCWDELLLLQKLGIIFELERQKIYRFITNEIQITHYRCDFRFKTKDGKLHVADAKSPHSVRFQRWGLIKRCMRAYYGIWVIEFISKDSLNKDSVATDVKKLVYDLAEKC